MKQLRTAQALRLLGWGSVIAPAIIAALIGAFLWHRATTDARQLAQVNARLVRDFAFSLVQAHDVALTAAEAGLNQTGMSGAEGRGMHQFLDEMASRIPMGLGISLIDPDGDFLLSSAAHPVEGSAGDVISLAETEDDARLFIDRMRVWSLGADALVMARRRAGAPEGVWVSSIRIAAVEDFLRAISGASHEAASLLRTDGRLLVRHPSLENELVLDPASPAMEAIDRASSGIFEAEGADGRQRIYAFAQVGDTPLYATFGVSKAQLFVRWLTQFAGAAGILGALSLTSYGLVRSVSRGVEAETAQAALDFNGRLLMEANRTAEAREMMFKELNHRIKNSLQMIRSLVRLQAQRPGGPDLEAINSRVMAIATIHDLLYRSANSFEIDLASLLEQILASDAIAPPERNVGVVRRLDPLSVDAAVATPLALCAIELVTNAAKHAFGPEGGVITVDLSRQGSQATLIVADGGKGIAANPSRNSGLRVVDALVLQFGGTLTIIRDLGTRFEITFPAEARPDPSVAESAGFGSAAEA